MLACFRPLDSLSYLAIISSLSCPVVHNRHLLVLFPIYHPSHCALQNTLALSFIYLTYALSPIVHAILFAVPFLPSHLVLSSVLLAEYGSATSIFTYTFYLAPLYDQWPYLQLDA